MVFGEAVNDLRSPSFLLLSGEDFTPNLPVEDDRLLIDGERCSYLCLAYARFEVFEKNIIIIGGEQGIVLRQGTFPSFAGTLLSG